MKRKEKSSAVRRQPKQRRARETVEVILDAVTKVLKKRGVDGVTTSRIAEVAGVSIGSVYQYFPDKRANESRVPPQSNPRSGAREPPWS